MNIELFSNKFGNCTIIIDDEDALKIQNCKLIIESDFKNKPVCRDRKTRKSLHSIILNLKEKTFCKFKNGDKLDNRKSNLLYGRDYSPYNRKKKQNKIIYIKNHAEIVIESPKYGTKYVKIDVSDVEKILLHRWYVVKDHNTFYCVTKEYNKKRISLHRYLLNALDKEVVDHKDGNGLNNRRKNIRLTTQEINSKNRKKNKRNKSGYSGVFETNTAWYSSWFVNKHAKQKRFSKNKYGSDIAMKLAILHRKEKEENHDYYSRKKLITIIRKK